MIVRYFAAIRAAAGVDQEQVDAADVAAALTAVRAGRDARFGQVLDVCAFLLDEAPVGDRDRTTLTVGPDSVLDCLPPFAGG